MAWREKKSFTTANLNLNFTLMILAPSYRKTRKWKFKKIRWNFTSKEEQKKINQKKRRHSESYLYLSTMILAVAAAGDAGARARRKGTTEKGKDPTPVK
jgi:hypothetical protein